MERSGLLIFWEDEHTNKLKDGILEEPDVCYGIKVTKIKEQAIPDFGEGYRFKVASLVLVRANLDDGRLKHLRYNEKQADEILTKRMKTKINNEAVQKGF